MSRFAVIELRRGQTAVPDGHRLIAKGDDLEEVVNLAALKSGISVERTVPDGGDD